MDISQTLLVVLPGWGGNKTTWHDFFTTYRTSGNAIHILELPCFGDEPCPKDPWGIEQYAQFVSDALQDLHQQHKDKSIVLLGHSFGGQVATQLLNTNLPGALLIKGLILSGAAIIRPKNYARRAIFFCISKIGKFLCKLPLLSSCTQSLKKVLYRASHSPDYQQTADVKRSIFTTVIRQDVSHLAKNISCPTLIMWGTKDRYTPLKHGKKIATMIPQATFVTIDGGSHGLHQKHIDEMLSHIYSFIKSV